MHLALVANLDDLAVFGVWVTSLIGAVIAIIVVVLLAFGITRTVLVIDERLDAIIAVGQRIQNNTNALFDLEKTMKLAEQLRSTASAIEDDAKGVLGRAGIPPSRARMGR